MKQFRLYMKNVNRGTTLVELMATIAILSLVMTPISIMLYNGYKAYFEEHDKMIALGKTNDAIELVINDLRKFESESTIVDNVSGERLMINDSIVYFYDKSLKTIQKNGTSIFTDVPDIRVLNFKVIEKSELGYDTKLIGITIDLEYRKSGVINLSNTYRRRY